MGPWKCWLNAAAICLSSGKVTMQVWWAGLDGWDSKCVVAGLETETISGMGGHLIHSMHSVWYRRHWHCGCLMQSYQFFVGMINFISINIVSLLWLDPHKQILNMKPSRKVVMPNCSQQCQLTLVQGRSMRLIIIYYKKSYVSNLHHILPEAILNVYEQLFFINLSVMQFNLPWQ